jgi:hypothetical protein
MQTGAAGVAADANARSMWIDGDGDVPAGFRRRNIACGFHMMK